MEKRIFMSILRRIRKSFFERSDFYFFFFLSFVCLMSVLIVWCSCSNLMVSLKIIVSIFWFNLIKYIFLLGFFLLFVGGVI